MSEDFSAIRPLLEEYTAIERDMADPAVVSDPGALRRLGRRYAELGRVVTAHRAWETASADLADAVERRTLCESWLTVLMPTPSSGA